MALLRSGSHNDVELVRIETTELTLIIKGKPFHERYEGLKSYRKMDFHDVMDFSVYGENIKDIKVFNIDTEELDEPHLLRPIFFENGIYQLVVVPKVDKEFSFYHEHPRLREAVRSVKLGNQELLMGNLHYQNEIGFSYLEILDGRKQVLKIKLEIFPVKLDYKKDYRQLLTEVNDEIYNLAFHFIRKTFLHARLKLDGEPSRTEFYRLITHHFQQFIQALNRIELQPHHKLETTYTLARGDQLRKQDASTRSYLRKNPQLFTEVPNGIEIYGTQRLPVKGLRIRKVITYDTLENRYIKWMIYRLIDKLNDLQKSVMDTEGWGNEPDPDVIKKIGEMRYQLESKLKKPFWKKINKLDQSIMSLVMQMAPGYRDAFQIYLIVSKGLMLQSSIYRMSVKDIAVLYEYWTFLKLGQILSRKYIMISQDIVKVNQDGLFVNLQSNKRAKRVFRHPITKEEISLIYQSSYRASPTTSQIPDTMLQIEKKGKDYTFNYIFDAKYRIEYALEGSSYGRLYNTPGPMEEDINTMHRYRDSIVSTYDGPYERTSFGAYVLFPWIDEDIYQNHHFYKSIDKVNIGGLPFLPNATTLIEKVVENLIDKSPEEIHKEGILPRGALDEWKAEYTEKVIVGLVSTPEDYQKSVQEKVYSISISSLRNGWQEAKYVALYLKKGVGPANGVTMYGAVRGIDFLKDRVLFHVNHWISLETVIKPVNYGIASYVVTTIDILKSSKELPELFMRSKEEATIWRMLRRISDQIKIELNAENVDEASEIKEYRVKDIGITINTANKELILSKENKQKVMNIMTLQHNPSTVFKKIREMIIL